jgi:methyl-accepting chemotaxis protein
MINSRDIRADLEALANQVDTTDTKAATRLRELGNAVDGGSYADAWATTDVHHMIETDAIVQKYKRMQKTDKAVAILELFRNSLIFLPLVVTWYGVSVAVSTYHDLIRDKPDFASLPFLYLWQGAFDNRLHTWQTLGFLAAVDFVILLIVFGLTALLSYMTSIGRQRHELEAEELREDLIHALAGATLCLHTRNWTQPTNFVNRFDKVTEQFNTVVGQLLKTMEHERTQLSELAKQQKESSEAFIAFKKDLFSNMSTVSLAVKEMQASNTALSTTINSLVTPARDIASQHGSLTTHTQEAVTLFRDQVAAQNRIVEQQQLWGEELQRVLGTLNGTVQYGKELASSVAGFTGQQAGFLEAIKIEREQQRQTANSLFTSADNLKKIVDQINECLVEWQGVNVNMYGLIGRIAAQSPMQRTVK